LRVEEVVPYRDPPATGVVPPGCERHG
jgi:hypothetical protein